MNFNWPLNENNFSFKDRLRIAAFILKQSNRWTQGEQVKKFEREVGEWVGAKAVFVSSGSTANTLLAYRVKDELTKKNSDRNIVVLPSVTWQTSCAPWVREGFAPHFIDISLKDYSMDLSKLRQYLFDNHSKVAVVFITALLGYVPNMIEILFLQNSYPNIRFMMDNCENTFGAFNGGNVSSFLTSTTSTYFGHQIQSIEGGFIFTQNQQEYEYFKLARNHGLTRSLLPIRAEKYRNHDVDERFDFCMLGNNFRNTDLNAFIGRIDFGKRNEYIQKRTQLYRAYADNLDEKYLLPLDGHHTQHVAFALPIVTHPTFKLDIQAVLDYCAANSIETRPMVSGNLLRQTPYKQFAKATDFPNAEHLHFNGLYVGLYPKLSEKNVLKLVSFLNQLPPCPNTPK